MGGLKTGPSRRHRIQPAEGPFLDPVQRKRVSKRGQKVARLKSKVVPPGGSSLVPFWPLQCDKSVEAFISSRS